MARSKLVEANEKIAEGVVGGYRKIEEGVVEGYRKMEEGAACGRAEGEGRKERVRA